MPPFFLAFSSRDACVMHVSHRAVRPARGLFTLFGCLVEQLHVLGPMNSSPWFQGSELHITSRKRASVQDFYYRHFLCTSFHGPLQRPCQLIEHSMSKSSPAELRKSMRAFPLISVTIYE